MWSTWSPSSRHPSTIWQRHRSRRGRADGCAPSSAGCCTACRREPLRHHGDGRRLSLAARCDDVAVLRAVTVGVAMFVLAGACAAPTMELSDSFRRELAVDGQQFRPRVPADGVVPPDAALELIQRADFPPFATDRTADPPIFGVIRCIGPARCPSVPVEPGEELPIWLIGYPRAATASGGHAWAVIDARTGRFLFGDGPPGP